MTITLIALSGIFYLLFIKVLFLRLLFVLTFGTYPFFSSFGLTVCVYVLGEIATPPSFEGVFLYRRLTLSFNFALALGFLLNLCD